MLSARWRRRPFCLQRNTTSRGNPKEREGEMVSFFLDVTPREKAFLGWLGRLAKGKEGGPR